MNNDIEVINADWLEEMISVALQANVARWAPNCCPGTTPFSTAAWCSASAGIASRGAQALPQDDAGLLRADASAQRNERRDRSVPADRQSIYKEVGGLDEQLHVAYSDIDFCLRVRRAGYRNVWTPYAELYHRSRPRAAPKTRRKKSAASIRNPSWSGSAGAICCRTTPTTRPI